jgi:hypothetical protein
MEGQGVTNYQPGKSSYGYSARTTEFDDACIQRGILTHEQAIFSKGASSEEAIRLAGLKNSTACEQESGDDDGNEHGKEKADDGDDEDEDDYLLEDDEFLDRYRQQRLEELQEEKSKVKGENVEFGEVVLIARDEWNRHVNEDSMKHWVVVCLTSSDTERTGRVEEAVRQLAGDYRMTKFILIPSRSAIPNWPDSNLPSIFLYRHGKMQSELVRLSPETNVEELEGTLRESGVL